jgi:hypothetical protein
MSPVCQHRRHCLACGTRETDRHHQSVASPCSEEATRHRYDLLFTWTGQIWRAPNRRSRHEGYERRGDLPRRNELAPELRHQSDGTRPLSVRLT